MQTPTEHRIETLMEFSILYNSMYVHEVKQIRTYINHKWEMRNTDMIWHQNLYNF